MAFNLVNRIILQPKTSLENSLKLLCKIMRLKLMKIADLKLNKSYGIKILIREQRDSQKNVKNLI